MTITADLATFRQWFPELSVAEDPRVTQGLLMASLWIDPAMWSPSDYPQAVMFWAAHWVQLIQTQSALSARLGGGTGSIDAFLSSISIGERTVSFQQRQRSRVEAYAGPGEEMLEQTMYGQMFLQLRGRNIIPVMIV